MVDLCVAERALSCTGDCSVCGNRNSSRSVTKEKIPCPAQFRDEPCSSDCPVCHGRGNVRPWTLLLEIDLDLDEAREILDRLRELPVGLTIKGYHGHNGRFTLVVHVLRYHLSEAVSLAGDYFSAAGRSPFCRKAW